MGRTDGRLICSIYLSFVMIEAVASLTAFQFSVDWDMNVIKIFTTTEFLSFFHMRRVFKAL